MKHWELWVAVLVGALIGLAVIARGEVKIRGKEVVTISGDKFVVRVKGDEVTLLKGDPVTALNAMALRYTAVVPPIEGQPRSWQGPRCHAELEMTMNAHAVGVCITRSGIVQPIRGMAGSVNEMLRLVSLALVGATKR